MSHDPRDPRYWIVRTWLGGGGSIGGFRRRSKSSTASRTSVGPQGPPGPQGATGPTGPQGDFGSFPDWLVLLSDYEAGDGDVAAFNRALLAVPEGGTVLFDRAGDYSFGGSLAVNKACTLQGGNPTQSTGGVQDLLFTTASSGLVVSAAATIRDFVIRYNIVTVAEVHGIHATAPVHVENCFCRSWQGDGYRLDAGSSGSYLENCVASLCGKNGFHAAHSSASLNTLVACNATLNGSRAVVNQDIGFLDESAEGSTYVMCHCANNGSADTDYKVTLDTAKSQFDNCYSEGAGGADLGKLCLVVNGLMRSVGGGIRGGWLDMTTTSLDIVSRTQWTAPGTLGANLEHRPGGADEMQKFYSSTDDPDGFSLSAVDLGGGQVEYQLRHNGGTPANRVAYGLTATGGRGAGYFRTGRLIARSVRISSGTLAERPASSVAEDAWSVGDVWWNAAYSAGTPFFWKVSAVGGGGALTWVDGPLMP